MENKEVESNDDVLAEETANDHTCNLEGKIAELEDRILRMAAELQNVQKRADKEVADAYKFSVSSFAKDVLIMRDSLQLAIVSSIENEDNKSIIEGIKLTMSEIDKSLEKHGIRRSESMNQKFDPNLHQAMIEIQSECEPGIVIQVMQEGFTINERLLRPALVGVSKK